MKKTFLVLTVVVGIFLSACTKQVPVQDDYYDRANQASKESLKGLNAE